MNHPDAWEFWAQLVGALCAAVIIVAEARSDAKGKIIAMAALLALLASGLGWHASRESTERMNREWSQKLDDQRSALIGGEGFAWVEPEVDYDRPGHVSLFLRPVTQYGLHNVVVTGYELRDRFFEPVPSLPALDPGASPEELQRATQEHIAHVDDYMRRRREDDGRNKLESIGPLELTPGVSLKIGDLSLGSREIRRYQFEVFAQNGWFQQQLGFWVENGTWMRIGTRLYGKVGDSTEIRLLKACFHPDYYRHEKGDVFPERRDVEVGKCN